MNFNEDNKSWKVRNSTLDTIYDLIQDKTFQDSDDVYYTCWDDGLGVRIDSESKESIHRSQ